MIPQLPSSASTTNSAYAHPMERSTGRCRS
jgi:hypothetical protein